MKKIILVTLLFIMYDSVKAQVTTLNVVNNTCFNITVNPRTATPGTCTALTFNIFPTIVPATSSTTFTFTSGPWTTPPGAPTGSWEFFLMPYFFDDGSGSNCGAGSVDACLHTVDIPSICAGACAATLKATWSSCGTSCATVTFN